MLSSFPGLKLRVDLGCSGGYERMRSVIVSTAAAAGSNDVGFRPSDEGPFTSLAGLRLRRGSLVRDTGDRERRLKRDGFEGSVWSKRERFVRGASSAILAARS
jgi:hypothetical protein